MSLLLFKATRIISDENAVEGNQQTNVMQAQDQRYHIGKYIVRKVPLIQNLWKHHVNSNFFFREIYFMAIVVVLVN
jgi:hypothetical protein